MSDSPPIASPVPEPTPTPGRSVAVIGVLGIVVVAGVIWWLRPPGELLEHVQPMSLAGTPLEKSRFIGSKACRECARTGGSY